MFSSLFRGCQSRSPLIRTRLTFNPSTRSYAASAAKTPIRPPRPSPPPSAAKAKGPSPLASVARPSGTDLNNIRRLQKLQLAERLFENGDTLLYKTSERLTAFRLWCWLIGAACFVGIIAIQQIGVLRLEDLKKQGIHPAIGVSYIVICMFLSGTGFLCLRRAGGQIGKIELVKKSNIVVMQVTTRGYAPFYTNKLICQPKDLLVDPRLVQMRRVPAWMLAKTLDESSPSAVTRSVMENTIRAVPRFFFNLWHTLLQFFRQEGIVTIKVVQSRANDQESVAACSLDTAGDFLTIDGRQQLFDMATFLDPYNPDHD